MFSTGQTTAFQHFSMALILTIFSLHTYGADTRETTAITATPSIRFCSEPVELHSGFNATFGLASKIIRGAVSQAGETLGYQVTFIEQPWRRCMSMARDNLVDGIIASVWQEERSQWIQFPLSDTGKPETSKHVWVSHYSIFVTPDTELSWNGEQFSGIKHGIGSPLGYVLTEQLKELGVLNQQVNSAETGLHLVARGLLDGFITERSIGYSHIEAMKLEGKVVALPITFSQQHLYVPLSKGFYREDPARGELFFELVSEYYRATLE